MSPRWDRPRTITPQMRELCKPRDAQIPRSLWFQSGRPKYFTGRVPLAIPVAFSISAISASLRPDGKKQIFGRLIDSPDNNSNSLRIRRMFCTDLSDPSEKIRRSSAKQRL